jgi:hypothetical protein
MDPKPRPNRKLYIEGLRRMTGEQRMLKAFELTQMTRDLLEAGLRARFPDLAEPELRALVRLRLERCHNRNY